MKSKITLLALFLPLLVTVPSLAQDHGARLSDVWAEMAPTYWSCGTSVYDTPTNYDASAVQTTDGEFSLITQGGCGGREDCDGEGDALFYYHRSFDGTLSTPGSSDNYPGAITNLWQSVSIAEKSSDPCNTTNKLTTYTGALGSPSVVKLYDSSRGRYRYYMAFLLGNGDWWHGTIGWAVSDDAKNWTVYTGGASEAAPIFYGKYQRGIETTSSCPQGFSALAMMTREVAPGEHWFYIYGTYHHRPAEGGAGTTSVTLRFKYDGSHYYGFPSGSSDVQIWYNGTFQPTSGALVWQYDPHVSGDDVLNLANAESSWDSDYFPTVNSVTRTGDGRYMMVVDKWGTRNNINYLKYRLSSDGVAWSGTHDIDISMIQSDPDLPAGTNKYAIHNEVWYGTVGHEEALWGFLSWSNRCSSSDYHGTTLIPVKLEFCDAGSPCVEP